LDSNIASHDKVLALLSDPSSTKWQALSSYMCALGWAGGQGTDGFIPRIALPFVHGTAKTARLLEKYHLWEVGVAGWMICNYAARQELEAVTAGKKAAQQVGAARTNCQRWHGKECGCWKVKVA